MCSPQPLAGSRPDRALIKYLYEAGDDVDRAVRFHTLVQRSHPTRGPNIVRILKGDSVARRFAETVVAGSSYAGMRLFDYPYRHTISS
jgi:predicted NAD/FAD-binding protein